jgi:hypothetical protein
MRRIERLVGRCWQVVGGKHVGRANGRRTGNNSADPAVDPKSAWKAGKNRHRDGCSAAYLHNRRAAEPAAKVKSSSA